MLFAVSLWEIFSIVLILLFIVFLPTVMGWIGSREGRRMRSAIVGATEWWGRRCLPFSSVAVG